MKNLLLARLVIFTILVLTASTKLFAAGGDLDTTFNAGVSAGFGSGSFAVAVQTDGRVLVGGSFMVAGGLSRPNLARFNADGTVDQSFNVGTGANEVVRAIAVQTDGKILIGGDFYQYDGAAVNYLARLNADGSLDTSFNMGGAGPAGQVYAIALQTDGKIFIGGGFGSYNGTTANNFARLNTNGSLDTAFNTNLGTGFNSYPLAVAVESSGKILVGGSFTSVNGTTANYIARLNSNGTPDSGFITNNGTGFNSFVQSFAIQTDGKIVVGGSFSDFNGTSRNPVARLNSTGTLDTGFNPVISNNTILSVVIQTDGKIIATGNTIFGAFDRQYIARLNQSDGSLDLTFDAGTGPDFALYQTALQLDGTIFAVGSFTSFSGIKRSNIIKLNTNGSVNTAFSAVLGITAPVNDILVLPDGKILIGGNFRAVNECYCDGIAKLNADGTTDTAFNPGSGTNGYAVNALAVQTDNKILVGGNFFDYGSGTNDAITRLNADGSPDAAFNASVNGSVTSIAIQTDGKIIIGGGFDFVNGTFLNNIARLNADGSLDMTFNTGTGFDFQVNSVVILTGGQILVGGNFNEYNGTMGVGHIARLNSNGTLDTTFQTNTGTGFDLFGVNKLAVQTDGKIIAGGNFTSFNGAARSGIARLNSNGTLDGTFSVGTGFNGYVNDLTLQTDGRILAVGSFNIYNGITANQLARLNTDGSLDASFDSGADSFTTLLNAVALQTDGRILIGGSLSLYDNTPRSGIARVIAGDTITWTGAMNNDWHTAANWSTNFVPTSVDNAIIGNNFTVNITSANASVLTVTIGTNSTLNVASSRSLAIEGGTNNGTISGAGTLNFNGTALGNSGTISVSSVNANFATSGNKALTGTGAFVGNLLTIASGVTFALQNNHTFNNVSIGAGGALNATSRMVNLRGANPLQGTGGFVNTFGTTIFDGMAAQTVSASVNYYNLTVNNAAGVNFSGANSVGATLNLTSGILSNTSPLVLGNTANAVRTSGYVSGAMSKSFAATGAFTYPVGTANGYSPVEANITALAVNPSGLTVSATQTIHPTMNATNSLKRFWTLTESGDLTVNLTFNYLDPTDITSAESTYKLYRVVGGMPLQVTPFTLNTAANTIAANGITDFSDWAVGNAAPTTAQVSLGGRVLTESGNGISKAVVIITSFNGETHTAQTNSFGYYNFNGLEAGATYVVSVRHKQFQFVPDSIIVTPYENVNNLMFYVSPPGKSNGISPNLPRKN